MRRLRLAGLTLIETIIYIALFSMLMAGVLGAAYQIIQSSAHTTGRSAVQEEGAFVLRKIDWAFSGMASVSLPSASELVVTKYDGSTADIKLLGTHALMRENSGMFVPITTDAVRVSSLTFTVIPAAGAGPAGVSATLVLNGTEFSTTRYVRK